MSSTRSRNNNVFKFSSYWRTWSRVLWHKSDRKLQEKISFDPKCYEWVELDLTPSNPTSGEWYHVQVGNVREHLTALSYGDLITGSLPDEMVREMQKNMPAENVERLLHADYMPYLDFDKGRLRNNGGFNPNDAFKDFISIERYLAEMQAGPGVFIEDIREDYERTKAHWDRKIDLLRLKGD